MKFFLVLQMFEPEGKTLALEDEKIDLLRMLEEGSKSDVKFNGRASNVELELKEKSKVSELKLMMSQK